MKKSNETQLQEQGYFLKEISLPPTVREAVIRRDWNQLDALIQTQIVPGGIIFNSLREYESFERMESIIAIRSSLEYPDEDGIWHDDGSRVLAFSLSLTVDQSTLSGGILEVKKIASETSPALIPTPAFGTMIVFATGVKGFEHRITRVLQGERIIIAGWCYASEK